MQSTLAQFGFGPLSVWELVPLLGACALVALVIVGCVPGRRRPVNPRLFPRLIHRVQDRRGQLFLRPPPQVWHSDAREHFLESVRERLRASDFFRRDSDIHHPTE